MHTYSEVCTICFCEGPVNEGICCPSAHYTCAECFEAYVRSESGKSLGELKKRDGRVVCPANTDAMKGDDRCHAPPFSDKDIASKVSDEAFTMYLNARDKMREEQMVRLLLAARHDEQNSRRRRTPPRCLFPFPATMSSSRT